ncbi:MAG: cytochrome P450 [Labilithrix sp.]|nr:cytochrome P450 [Labilithrix sp.]
MNQTSHVSEIARPRPSSNLAPGPKGLPFFGSVLPAWRDPLALMTTSRETYGDVVRFKFGPFDYYLVTDPDVVRHVLVDNAKAYTKSRNYLGLKIVLGEGLLTSEGEQWRRQRKLAQPAFHRSHLAGFADQMSRATRAMLDRWRAEDVGASRAFCVHEEMMRLTFRIVGLTLFSADVDGDARDVGRALDTALRWANDYAESLVRIPPYVPTPSNIRFKRAMKTLDGIVYRLIADRRAQAAANAGFGSDLLGMLMAVVEEGDGASGAGKGMTDRQLRDEIITMVLAGHETTANLLSWTFSLLAEHPEIEARVRDEATRVLGDRDPVLEDVRALEYTKLVIEEALRLYPPAWMFERQSVEADTLGGYSVKAGSIVGVCPYVIHRHPRYWDRPDAFDPERFRPERAEGRPRYAYLPFGGGARTCIGNHFAMMEAQIILAMIVRQERLALAPGHRVELDPLITLRPKHGVRVTRRPAGPTGGHFGFEAT